MAEIAVGAGLTRAEMRRSRAGESPRAPALRGCATQTRPRFDRLNIREIPLCKAHSARAQACADSVVVITRRCQRLNPGSSPGRRTIT